MTRTVVQPTAHPRSRGENSGVRTASRAPVGSSPLTRGKHLLDLGRHRYRRLIPAHAGKTDRLDSVHLRPEAHPRSRGENLVALRSGMTLRGSSPLTRGKRRLDQVDQPRWRLIPAHAGKTSSTPEMRYERTAHPRSRGENASVREHPILLRGSSPLTRGKLHQAEAGLSGVRLIPAHAGKTASTR